MTRWVIQTQASLQLIILTTIQCPSKSAAKCKWFMFCQYANWSIYIDRFFRSPDLNCHARYCHHIASVVCKLFFYILICSKAVWPVEIIRGWHVHALTPTNCRYFFFIPIGCHHNTQFNIGSYGKYSQNLDLIENKLNNQVSDNPSAQMRL